MREVKLFSVAELEHHRCLMRDVKCKVPLGNHLKLDLGMNGYEPNSFDQWVALVQNVQELVSKGSRRAQKAQFERTSVLCRHGSRRC